MSMITTDNNHHHTGTSHHNHSDDVIDLTELLDAEPLFTYTRYNSTTDLCHILYNNTITIQCVTYNAQYICCGTDHGTVHIFNLDSGNELVQLPIFAHHHKLSRMITSIDITNDWLIVSCIDCTVVIININTAEQYKSNYSAHHGNQYNIARISPDYSATQQYIVGINDKLIWNNRGWYGINDTVVHSNEGRISNIAINNDCTIVAWSNNTGVKLYDLINNQRVSYITKPSQNELLYNEYKIQLYWYNATTLYIAYGNYIRIVTVKQRKSSTPPTSAHHRTKSSITQITPVSYIKYAQVTYSYTVDYNICGISHIDNQFIILIGYSDSSTIYNKMNHNIINNPLHSDDTDTDTEHSHPCNTHNNQVPPSAAVLELHVLTISGTDIYNEAIPIQHYSDDTVTVHNTTLHTIPNSDISLNKYNGVVYYISTPHDIINIKLYTINNHIEYALRHNQFDYALEQAKQYNNDINNKSIQQISDQYLYYLFDSHQYAKAAGLTPSLLASDEQRWIYWISKFREHNSLKLVSTYIPTVDCVLSAEIYESIIYYFLFVEPLHVLTLLQTWPHSVYNIQSIITTVQEQYTHTNDTNVQSLYNNILAELYYMNKQWNDCIRMFIHTHRHDIFQIIVQHDLYTYISNRLYELIQFDPNQAIKLYVEHSDRINVDHVVTQLQSDERIQYQYLYELFQYDKHISKKYHTLQIQLCIKYDRSNLLSTLQRSYSYDCNDILQLCLQDELYNAAVYILRRLDRTDDALDMCINELNDVKQAIELVDEHTDNDELFNKLISKALNNHILLSQLLVHIGTRTLTLKSINDLNKLIQSIPDTLHIKQLQHKLVQLLNDCNMQYQCKQTSYNILSNDVIQLHEKYVRRMRRAIYCHVDTICCICQQPMLSTTNKYDKLYYFHCQHHYHHHCIIQSNQSDNKLQSQITCSLCNQQDVQKSININNAIMLHEPNSPLPYNINQSISNTAQLQLTNGVQSHSTPSTPSSHKYRQIIRDAIKVDQNTVWSDSTYF